MCVGNMLSRKEMTVAFNELLRRLDDIQIREGAELQVSPNLLLRGFISVPITFKKAAAEKAGA
jgi:cytochrome P450